MNNNMVIAMSHEWSEAHKDQLQRDEWVYIRFDGAHELWRKPQDIGARKVIR